MDSNLRRTDARHRSHALAVTTYDVAVDLSTCLDPTQLTYPTSTTVVFASADADTFMDFLGENVHHVDINGQAHPVDYDGARIHLHGLTTSTDPHAADAPTNTVTIRGAARYSRSGEGLHRYVDPADGHTYLYTQYEPSDARRVFANFEQPDLKAQFTFTITAPTDWEVLSNQPETHRTDAGTAPSGHHLSRRTYAPTPPLSTYLTCIVAGPYRRWTSHWDGRVVDHGTGTTHHLAIPLGVLCRQSLADSFDPDEFLTITKQGLDYFHEQFRYPYPWGKYDQVLVPEYNLGAMENPGLVTYTDAGYVFQSGATRSDHEARANTILHEMSHMWFGDLVTPQWWDDLWLKESFADYMGTAAAAEATEFTDAWTSFCARRKAWAYRADQLPTTHPIVADIPDVEAASQNFDGITYAKGASVVRQLVAYVGRDAFTDGVRAYFARHAYRNTTLDDLLIELEKTSGRDLRSWSQHWLHTTGMSTLTATLTDHPATLTLTQDTPGDTGPRPHRVAIGCYHWDHHDSTDTPVRRLRRTDLVETDLTGTESTLPLPEGPRPDLIVVNDTDLTYAKVRLDPTSTTVALDHLPAVEDSLTRATLAAALWNACRDGHLPAARYLQHALTWARHEPDVALVSFALNNALTTSGRYAPADLRADLRSLVVDAAWDAIHDGTYGDGHRLAWARCLATASLTCDSHLTHLATLLDGSHTIPGLPIAPELRWQLLRALTAHGRTDVSTLHAERDHDRTSLAPIRLARALASRPDPTVKADAMTAVLTDLTLSNHMVSALADGYATPGQEHLRRADPDRYYAALEEIWASRSIGLAQRAVEGLFPDTGDLHPQTPIDAHDTPHAAQQWLDAHPDAPTALRRAILELRDDAVRALTVQACR
ncbi:Aminopeptidase N [Austwickia sp. TVS 96-490-7B]|uniref:aminopeptidase N n=1 Tax=Austwickia sp. TVS 96-490-7B TaxID=2830843 RepID=UPI001C58D5B3|nr:aminopeptidase N [Austwickia sp. TVS 96-490-7B]MBW3086862.1 Aminopeptidase N [Austwickia sp. TVS 96-490-7B]